MCVFYITHRAVDVEDELGEFFEQDGAGEGLRNEIGIGIESEQAREIV